MLLLVTMLLLSGAEPGSASRAQIGAWADCAIQQAIVNSGGGDPPELVADDALGSCRRFATAFRKTIARDYKAIGKKDAEDKALLFTEELRQMLHMKTVESVRKFRRERLSSR